MHIHLLIWKVYYEAEFRQYFEYVGGGFHAEYVSGFTPAFVVVLFASRFPGPCFTETYNYSLKRQPRKNYMAA